MTLLLSSLLKPLSLHVDLRYCCRTRPLTCAFCKNGLLRSLPTRLCVVLCLDGDGRLKSDMAVWILFAITISHAFHIAVHGKYDMMKVCCGVCFRDYTYFDSSVTTTTSYSFHFEPGNKAPPYDRPPPARKIGSVNVPYKKPPLPPKDLPLHEYQKGKTGSQNSSVDQSPLTLQSELASPYSPPRPLSQSEHSYYNVPPNWLPSSRSNRQKSKDPWVHRNTPPYAPDGSLPKFRNYRQITQMLQRDLEEAVVKVEEELYLSPNAIPVLSHVESMEQRGLRFLPFTRQSSNSNPSSPQPYSPIERSEYTTVPLSPTFTRQGFKPPTPPLPRRHSDSIVIPDPPSEPAPSPPTRSSPPLPSVTLSAPRKISCPPAVSRAAAPARRSSISQGSKRRNLRVRFSEAQIIVPSDAHFLGSGDFADAVAITLVFRLILAVSLLLDSGRQCPCTCPAVDVFLESGTNDPPVM